MHHNKKIGDCENIYSANLLHLTIGKVDGNIGCNSVEEKNGSKHLVFDSRDETKKY